MTDTQAARHTKDNTTNGMKKAVQKRPIFQKEVTQFVINSKHTVAMGAVYKFKGHIGGTFLRVLDATKRRVTT